MQSAANLFTVPLVVGVALGLLVLVVFSVVSRRTLRRAEVEAQARLEAAEELAEARRTELLVSAQERAEQLRGELDTREEGLDARESDLITKEEQLERRAGELDAVQRKLDSRGQQLDARIKQAEENEAASGAARVKAEQDLERIAGLTPEEAKAELIQTIENEARAEGIVISRKIEEEARENAERAAIDLVLHATERVSIDDVLESTVSFIELPSDEMKGRIIGKEGRNIRALEMATGIDLVVDDTPRSILISSFDPVRREVARLAILQLVEDGRIHPARIEEVVAKVRSETDEMIEERGAEAAYSLGISDLNPRLARLVGELRFRTARGHNLLQHCLETALIAGYMAEELGCSDEAARRAGLLHEIGQCEGQSGTHPIHAAADLCAKYGEQPTVAEAIRSLHPDVKPRSPEALLLNTASRLSDQRPGARKENLAVFIERLRRLEEIAKGFDGVADAYAVKAGKEIRVIADTERTTDEHAFALSKKIARAVEKKVNYPGQIKVAVIRETRAVRFAV